MERDYILTLSSDEFGDVESTAENKYAVKGCVEYCKFVIKTGYVYAVEKLPKVIKDYTFSKEETDLINYQERMRTHWSHGLKCKIEDILDDCHQSLYHIKNVLQKELDELDNKYLTTVKQLESFEKSFKIYMDELKAKNLSFGRDNIRYNIKNLKEDFKDKLDGIVEDYPIKREGYVERIVATESLIGVDVKDIINNAIAIIAERKMQFENLLKRIDKDINANVVSLPPVSCKTFRLNDNDDVVSSTKTLTHLAQGTYYYIDKDGQRANLCMFASNNDVQAACLFGYIWENTQERLYEKIEEKKDAFNSVVDFKGIGTIDYLINWIERKEWVNKSILSFLQYLGRNDLANRAVKIREQVFQEREEQERARQKEEAEREAVKRIEREEFNKKELEYVQAAISRLEEHIVASKTPSEDELLELSIENLTLEIYKDTSDAWSQSDTCVVEHLFNYYDVKLPLKVLGWMRKNLCSVTFEDGKFVTGKVYTQSTTIFDYMRKLVDAAKERVEKRLAVA